MSKLKTCKDCGAEISKKADKCPQCGSPAKRKPLGCGALIAIIIAGGIWVSVLDSTSTPAPKPLPATAEDKAALEKKLLAELKTIPAKQFSENQARYQKLVQMFPSNNRYKDKLKHYNSKIARKNRIEASFSAWDGSHKTLAPYVEKNLKNPSSFEHVETVYVDKGDKLLIEMTYRATNSFGAVVTEKVYAESSIDGSNITLLSK